MLTDKSVQFQCIYESKKYPKYLSFKKPPRVCTTPVELKIVQEMRRICRVVLRCNPFLVTFSPPLVPVSQIWKQGGKVEFTYLHPALPDKF